MNGPISSDKEKLEKRSTWLERSLILAGAIVVAGLIGESRTVSAFLVTVGVFAEVVLGIFITKTSERIRELSNAEVAAANDRAAQALDRATKAEQATAEANLARAKIEQRMQPRHIDAKGREGLLGLLAKYPKMGIDVVVFEHHIPETQFISHQLLDCFISVGWRCRLWESRRAKYRLPGPSIIFAVASGYEDRFMELASALARALKDLDLDAGTSAGRFSAGSAFEPGDFEMVFQHPGVLFQPLTVVALRLQIGAKEFSAAALRPIAPPKA